jgi:catechol 2,3-dioxygenase-like lactoylglutathione lyase family enzyme
MVEIAKLGHVALVTPDVEGSLQFWRDVVGLDEVDRDGETGFLRA